ncbi:MAG: lipocalin family protein [Bacteroidota bacterium]
MKFKYLIVIFISHSFLSCWNKDANLTKEIVGEWRIVEIITQDLSKSDTKVDTIKNDNNHILWEFKSDKKSFILNGTSATRKGTFDITDEIVSFDFEDDFDIERMKIYELDDDSLVVGRKVKNVEYIKINFKKVKIE